MFGCVTIPHDAKVVAFFDSPGEYRDTVDAVRYTLSRMYRSATDTDKWLSREEHIVSHNKLVNFILCKRGNVCSLSIVPKLDACPVLAGGFCERVTDSFMQRFSGLSSIGYYSRDSKLLAPEQLEMNL